MPLSAIAICFADVLVFFIPGFGPSTVFLDLCGVTCDHIPYFTRLDPTSRAVFSPHI